MLVKARISIICFHDQKMMKSYVIFSHQKRDFFLRFQALSVFTCILRHKFCSPPKGWQLFYHISFPQILKPIHEEITRTPKKIASKFVIDLKYFPSLDKKLTLFYGTRVLEK